ncbi:LysR substrate-binding domain-containing protein [Candidatus Pantoea formicae]|uniref:LysR family transcriptional regulator n=1 Tax=Candidatus Pantoea formicae TaxID=2608355 RepID=UPI003EDA1BD7
MDRFQAMATYIRVVDTGSFSAAARQLNVGQPAVSKIVAQLESRLQTRLLTRSTHGLTPTEAGQRYYERALAALQEADEAELAARGAGKGLSGKLRISAATTFARLHIIPQLPAFLEEHPELDVDVILDDRVIDLIAEGIDVSLRMGNLPDSGVVARKLATGARSVIATPSYLSKKGEPTTPGDLAKHDAILYNPQPSVWTFTSQDAVVSTALSGRIRVSAAEGQRAAVLSHMGLCIASDWMFAEELRNGSVRKVLTSWQLPSIDLWAVFPNGRLASAKARLFAGFVEAIMVVK